MTRPEGLHDYPYRAPELTIDQRHQWLCDNEPVFLLSEDSGVREWLVTGHDLVRRVLADHTFSRALATGRGHYDRPEGAFLIDLDPPEHTRQRRLAAQAFSPARVATLRPRVQQLADDLIDQMLAKGEPADLAADLALPFSIAVISFILGVPAGDEERFVSWAQTFLSTTGDPGGAQQAALEVAAYIAGLIEQRRSSPGDDLLSVLVHSQQDSSRLSQAELVGIGTLLLLAGHETTATMITNVAYVLLVDSTGLLQQVTKALPDNPQLMEEILRTTPIGGIDAQPRVAARDTTLGGTLIRAGDTVRVAMEASNLDARQFPCPHRVDLARPNARAHHSFGHGAHVCLGANLARLELCVLFGALLSRLPQLRLAVPPQDVPWKIGLSVRGPRALPVAWS